MTMRSRIRQIAIAIDPNFAAAYNNRGKAQAALNRFDGARASFEIALEIDPDVAATKTNEAIACLVTGDYERGLSRYEARVQPVPQPRGAAWLGARAARRQDTRDLSEQGMGDTLQGVRYARLAAAQGASMVVESAAALVSLIAAMPEGVAQWRSAPTATLPTCDLRCPMLSLPLAFATTADDHSCRRALSQGAGRAR